MSGHGDLRKLGHGDGIRAAVTWLHARATEMNDPQAKAILNSAATNLGWAFQGKLMTGEVDPRVAPLPANSP